MYHNQSDLGPMIRIRITVKEYTPRLLSTVLRVEKTCVVVKVLDQRTDYVDRSGNRLNWTAFTGRVTNKSKFLVKRGFHFGNALEDAFSRGKVLFRFPLLDYSECDFSTKKETMSLHTTLLTKVYVKSRRKPPLTFRLCNFITLWDSPLHTSDRLIDSRRFTVEKSRNSDRLIYTIIIPRTKQSGTASTCGKRH